MKKMEANFLSDCTRMPADDVVENYESGSPVEEIAWDFDLKPDDIRAVGNFAAKRKGCAPQP